MGTPRKAPMGIGVCNSLRPIALAWLPRSATRTGPVIAQRYSKNRCPSGISQMRRASSAVSPETRRSSIRPSSSRVVMTP